MNFERICATEAQNVLWDSLALDKSTGLSSILQLFLFICHLNLDFQITVELISICTMHRTTTGEDVSMEVQKTRISFNVLELMEEKYRWSEGGSGG